MKFAPPGAEPFRTLTRVDGWFGNDPTRIPNSIAEEMDAAVRPYGRSEVDRVRARMTARQLAYERKKKVRLTWRRRFGLLTR